MRIVFAAACFLLFAGALSAQPIVSGSGRWKTIHTKHFQIHFQEAHRDTAVRASGIFEAVHDRIAAKYKDDGSVVHVAIFVGTDLVNSFATAYGLDQIVLFVESPRAGEFSAYDLWLELLFTHEYTHVLTLRPYETKPFARFLRVLLGFPPNLLSPRGLSEGIAVYEESKEGRGRLNDTLSRMVLRTAVFEKSLPNMGEVMTGSHRWPLGSMVYLYGGRLWKTIAEVYGEKVTTEYWQTDEFPFAISTRFRAAGAESYDVIYDKMIAKENAEFRKEIEAIEKAGVTPFQRLTKNGFGKSFLTHGPDGAVLFCANPPDQPNGIYSFKDGRIDYLRRVNECAGTTREGRSWITSEDYYFLPGYGFRQELYDSSRNLFLTRLAPERSMSYPTLTPGGEELFVIEKTAKERRLLVAEMFFGRPANYKEIFAVPVFGKLEYTSVSPDALSVVTVARPGEIGNGRLTLCKRPSAKSTDFKCSTIAAGPSVKTQPRFTLDGRSVLFSADPDGVFNLYSVDVDGGTVHRLTRTTGGYFYPLPAEKGLYAVGFFRDGYDLVFLDKESLLAERAVGFDALDPDEPVKTGANRQEILDEHSYRGPLAVSPYLIGLLPFGDGIGPGLVNIGIAARDPLERHFIAAAVGSSGGSNAAVGYYSYNRFNVGFSAAFVTDHLSKNRESSCRTGDEVYRTFCTSTNTYQDEGAAFLYYVNQGRHLNIQTGLGYVHHLIANARSYKAVEYDARDLNLNGPAFFLLMGRTDYYAQSISAEHGWRVSMSGEYFNHQNSYSNLDPVYRVPVDYGVIEGGVSVYLPSFASYHVNYLSAYGYTSVGPDREIQKVRLNRFVRGMAYDPSPSNYAAAVVTYEYRFPVVWLSQEIFSRSPAFMIREFALAPFVDCGAVFDKRAGREDWHGAYGISMIFGLNILYLPLADFRITYARGTGPAGEGQLYISVNSDFDTTSSGLPWSKRRDPILETRRLPADPMSTEAGYFRNRTRGGVLD